MHVLSSSPGKQTQSSLIPLALCHFILQDWEQFPMIYHTKSKFLSHTFKPLQPNFPLLPNMYLSSWSRWFCFCTMNITNIWFPITGLFCFPICSLHTSQSYLLLKVFFDYSQPPIFLSSTYLNLIYSMPHSFNFRCILELKKRENTLAWEPVALFWSAY